MLLRALLLNHAFQSLVYILMINSYSFSITPEIQCYLDILCIVLGKNPGTVSSTFGFSSISFFAETVVHRWLVKATQTTLGDITLRY